MLGENVDALHEHQPELPKRSELLLPQPDNVYFAEERKGWHGYVEWEKYPDKARRAAEILSKHKFAGVSPLNIDTASSFISESSIAGTRVPIEALARHEP